MKIPFLRPIENKSPDPFAARLAHCQKLCDADVARAVEQAKPSTQELSRLQDQIDEAQARISRLTGKRDQAAQMLEQHDRDLADIEERRRLKLDEYVIACASGVDGAEQTLAAAMDELDQAAQKASSARGPVANQLGAFDRQMETESAALQGLKEKHRGVEHEVGVCALKQAQARWDAAVNVLAVAGAQLMEAAKAANLERQGCPNFYDMRVPFISADRAFVGLCGLDYPRFTAENGFRVLSERTLFNTKNRLASGETVVADVAPELGVAA